MEDNSPNFDNEKLSENNEQKSTNSKTEDKNKFKKKDLNDPNPFSNIFDKERKDKIIKILEKYAPYFAKIIKEKKNTFNIEKVYQKFEVGRKKKGDNSDRFHNKNSPDNIEKKIKGKIMNLAIEFINSEFKKDGLDFRLKKQNFNNKEINTIIERKNLNTNLKDLLSQTKDNKNLNENIINSAIEKNEKY